MVLILIDVLQSLAPAPASPAIAQQRGTELEVATSIWVREGREQELEGSGPSSLRERTPERVRRERARGIRRMQMHCRHSSSFHGLFTKRRVPRAVQEPVLLAPNRTAEGASSAAYCRAAISGLRGAGRSGAFCGVQFSETYCGCADLPHGILHGVVCRAQTKPCRIPRGKSAR